jgi:hypothetical protein
MSPWLQVVTLILILAFLAGLFGIYRLYRFTFRPLWLIKGTVPGPTRFMVADILVLMILLQPCLALMLITGPEFTPGRICSVIVAVIFSLTVAMGWHVGVMTLSNYGVMATWRRVVYLLVVGPVTAVACLAAVVELVMLVVCLFRLAAQQSVEPLAERWQLLAMLSAAIGVAFAAAAWLTRWVARGAAPRTTQTPSLPAVR